MAGNDEAEEFLPFLQGLISDYRTDSFLRQNKNFDPGSGRSLQTIQAILTNNRKPEPNAAGKFLFSSRKKLFDGLTPRQKLAEVLAQRRQANRGKLHNATDVDNAKIRNMTLQSNKDDSVVVARPLMSYVERNTDGKKCMYGSYKDGSRYRCAQNLNHKKFRPGATNPNFFRGRRRGSGGAVRAAPRRPVTAAAAPARQATTTTAAVAPARQPQVANKKKQSRELSSLQAYLKDPPKKKNKN